jgi:hypothetical protein
VKDKARCVGNVCQIFVGLKLVFAVCGRGQEPFIISFIVLLPVVKLLVVVIFLQAHATIVIFVLLPLSYTW